MSQSRVAVLGTARDGFVITAAVELRNVGALVTVFVRRGREAAFLDAGLPVHTFSGRIAWYSLPLLAALRRVGATRIVVVVGDQHAHANVTAALNWWRAAGLLRGTDIYLSLSTQPAVLEGFNSVDQRERLGAAVAAIVVLAASVRFPVITLIGAAMAGGLELVARRASGWRAADLAPLVPTLPMLVDDPRLGWRARPVNITAIVTTTDASARTIRVTVDAAGQRTTGMPRGADDNRPAVALYGGSSVFGDSLSDEETMPWHVAALLPQYRIVNRAVPGYGASQVLAYVLDDFAHHPPTAAVVLVDEHEPAPLRTTGQARFPLSERLALWGLVRRVLSRARASRAHARALRTLRHLAHSEHPEHPTHSRHPRHARHSIPVVLINVTNGGSPESMAALVARDVRAALQDRNGS